MEKPLKSPTGDLPSKNPVFPLPKDTVVSKSDSLRMKRDSIALARRNRSDIETTIVYSARDSINSSLDKKIVHLYGDARIKYGEIELIAENITIDYTKSTITANGKLDSLGRRVGYPVFSNANEKYETKDIVYNFKTKKALITEVVTKQGDGFIHSEAAFKNPKNELLSLRNAYTTCNLAHPHYQIIATRAKAIPGDKIVVGPFYMEVNSVPLPVGFLFGMFPSPRSSSSGIVVPSYGEETNRGFFLRNGGYFFDVSDYFKFQITGDAYSKGSTGLHFNSNYRSRYSYSGNFTFNYTSNAISTAIENPTFSKDFQINWSHTPQTKGTGRFSASVSAATSSYTANNYLPLNTNPSGTRVDNTSRKLSSNISYSKSFGTLFTLGINYSINQDLVTKQVDMPLPDLSFNVNNLYPLKKLSQKMIFQNLSMRYTMTATNRITNNLGTRDFKDLHGRQITRDSIAPFNLQNLSYFIRDARKGVHHIIPISTSFKILNYFTVSPSINYDERWYFEKLHWTPSDDGTKAVVRKGDTLRNFNRLINYSTSANLTTRIYGAYFFKRKTGIQAIRHIIAPTIGFNYTPDFSNGYGYFDKITLKNSAIPVYQSVHAGFAYGGSSIGESAAITFGINNTVEMKVKSKTDTVAKKISLFNSLSINSQYNFAADSIKLSPFGIAANTNVLNDKLNISISATLDPYTVLNLRSRESFRLDTVKHEFVRIAPIEREVKLSSVFWQSNKLPGSFNNYDLIGQSGPRITNANLALSTNLNPKGRKNDTNTRDKITNSNASASDKAYLLANPDSYVDFNVPWNIRISYNVNYSHSLADSRQTTSPILITQTLRFNGDLSLTEKWKITYNSGYDFEMKAITLTQLGISRDIHCWVINLSWVPFGKYQNYTFFIGVKSSLLKDLKLNRTRSFFDN